MRRDSVIGRVLGILIFLLGIAILVVVAVVTYRLFDATTSGLQVAQGTADGAVAHLGDSAVRLLYQIALLIVLCVAGSLLAARGLHLYFVTTGSSSTGEPSSE